MRHAEIKALLEEWYVKTNQPNFIHDDPITIPHRFSKKQDIEISGLFAALMAWGNRKTIINKCSDLLNRMDNDPHQFVLHSTKDELKRLEGFVHRTLNDSDVLFLIDFLKRWYSDNESLEMAFSNGLSERDTTIEYGLNHFYESVFSTEWISERTRKHVASPSKKSACKRLNMYLRWMVREDPSGVDFGLWNSISPAQLVCPLDVHVIRVSSHLGLLERKQVDWKAALELTEALKSFDPQDPVKYDFALFGLGLAGFRQ